MTDKAWRYPLSDIAYGAAERDAVLRVLHSRWLTMGPEVEAFESEFAQAHNIAHAVMVTSGTAALELALDALSLRPGDEVIVPALTFVATANAVVRRGGVPIFADIESCARPFLCVDDVRRRLTPRTRAFIAVHYGGACADIVGLSALARDHDVAWLEDAAHVPGASGLGASAAACFSFYGNKNLVTGEGGMIATNRADIADRVRRLRTHGLTRRSIDAARGSVDAYDVLEHGTNARPSEIQAALGRAQLSKLAAHTDRRRAARARYVARLKDDVVIPAVGLETVAHLQTVLVPAERRDEVRTALHAAGVQTSVHYPCVHQLAAYAGVARAACPNAVRYAAQTITLPLHPGLTTDDVDTISNALRDAIAHVGAGR